MAEPARQQHPEIEPDIRPRLGVIQGGGESTPDRADLHEASPASSLEEQEKRLGVIQGGGESTPDRADLASVADQEENPNRIPYTGNGSSQNDKQPTRQKIVNFAKKKGPLTGIAGILLTSVFGLSLLSPGLLLVQLKETLTDKFNDQLTTMDIRQTAILKKKLAKTTTKGVCGSVITIRCKYQTLGDRHLKRLEAAGLNVEGDKNVLGRTKPTSFTFEGKPIAASDMLSEARSNPALRSAMRKGYNPKFAAFSDAIAAKVRAALGLKKSKNITPSANEDDMKKQLQENASGESAAGDGRATATPGKDADGNDIMTYQDVNGDKISKEEYDAINSANTEIENRVKIAEDVKNAGLKAGLKGALTATAIGAGAVDTLCTAWTVVRVASFAAKVYGARQLIRYSYQFINTADSIKAGDATPEEVAYLSKILTSTNSEGKSATDSDGYRYSAYGDVFSPGSFDTSVKGTSLTDAAVDKNAIQNETSKYVNGQIIPSNLMAQLVSKIGKADVSGADGFCKTVKSWQGQLVIFTAAVAGVIAAFASGGGTLGVGAALQAAAGVAASVAFALITPKLIDMAKGEVITGDENGNQAGNAIVSGMGGYNAQASQGRGLAVLNKQDAAEYAQASSATVADYNEVDRYEHGSLDPTSKNTFVGSIVNKLIPYTSKMSTSSSFLTSMTSLVTGSFGSIVTPRSDAADTKVNELSSCEDNEYQGLAADPFCNLRYGMSMSSLAIDPETVLTYMEDGGYIAKDSDDATPLGEYATYVSQCIERKNSIGDTLSPGDEGGGENCIQGKSGTNEERNTMFRLFYIDTSIQDGMDSDFDQGSTGTVGSGAEFRLGTFNICYGVATDGGYADCANGTDYKTRLDKTVSTIKTNGMQVVGLQEVRQIQWDALQKPDALGDQYDIYPKSYSVGYGAQNPVIWNKNDFELIEGKMIGGYTVTGGYDDKANTQVKLRYIGTEGTPGQEFYIINMHEPVGATRTDEKYRTESANARARYVQNLSSEGIPVFLTADFNSKYKESGPGVVQTGLDGTRENLPYCILTNSTGLWDAWDASSGRTGKCPSPDYNGSPGPVDHIYMSTNVSASSYKYFGGGVASNGSDHDTLYVDVKIPDGGEGGSCDTGCDARVATFNLRGASHDTATSTPWPERMDKSINIIEGKKLDVVGLQETQVVQRSALISKIGDTYDFFPDDKSVQNPIMWNKQKYSLVKGGSMPNLKYFKTSKLQAPWVILKSKTSGEEFYVLNTHDPAHMEDGNAQKRYQNALQHVEFIKSIQSKNIPIIFTGDFNSGYSLRHGTDNDTYLDINANLTYCVLTKNNLMHDVFDLAEKRRVTCPNPGNDNTVDHIFVSDGVSASNYQRFTNSGSDHDAHIIDLTFGSSGDSP